MWKYEDMVLRHPTLEDGMSVYQLISRCPPLDSNSSYCNFLQCGHFSDTSVCAFVKKDLVGFISAYLIPGRPDTLFVWQVAVDDRARGVGLAKKMLTHIVSRTICRDVQYLETTITSDNEASWSLFNSLGNSLAASLGTSLWLDRDKHFLGQHDSETLVRIGPFNLNEQETQYENF
jgi:L-2,4-diaminobutyric acid acetyltransferase